MPTHNPDADNVSEDLDAVGSGGTGGSSESGSDKRSDVDSDEEPVFQSTLGYLSTMYRLDMQRSQ